MNVPNPGLLSACVTDLTRTIQPPEHLVHAQLEKTQEILFHNRRKGRTEALRVTYDQSVEQSRLNMRRRLDGMQARANQRLQGLQRQLAENNETILRDVDSTLAVHATEAEMRRERLFIDWEMNVFLPIYANLASAIGGRDSAEYQRIRREAFQEYLDASAAGPVGLDASSSKYDPFRLTKALATVAPPRIDDPLTRPGRFVEQESRLVAQIGGTTPSSELGPPQARDIPVERYGRVDELYVFPDRRPLRRVLGPRGLTAPMATDAAEGVHPFRPGSTGAEGAVRTSKLVYCLPGTASPRLFSPLASSPPALSPPTGRPAPRSEPSSDPPGSV